MMSLVATRDGEHEVQPQGAIFGPKVMIINELAGSGGDAMPNYFRRAGVGKLIGKRTWGGLVGRAGAPPLMDGGFVTAPSSAVWSPAGEWDAENVGIAPGHRSRARSRARAEGPGSAAREGDRNGDGGAGEESGAETEAAGVSELPQEAGASDDASEAVSERMGGRPSDNRMIQPEPLKKTEPLV